MASQRRLRLVRVQIAGMLAVVLALVLLDALSLELFFVCSLLVLLVATELTEAVSVTPRWRRRIRLAILAGLVGFGYLVVRRIQTILS